MDSVAFWTNPAILVGIGTLLRRSQVRRFDRVDTQLRELSREVVENGKSIARIEDTTKASHPRPLAPRPEIGTLGSGDR